MGAADEKELAGGGERSAPGVREGEKNGRKREPGWDERRLCRADQRRSETEGPGCETRSIVDEASGRSESVLRVHCSSISPGNRGKKAERRAAYRESEAG